MSISKESLKGYILEEALAFLIKNAGYKLLVHPNQDPDNLEKRGHGLVLKGRGGKHQVDVLGELNWVPAFTFPMRLIVEAKFRNDTTGIGDIRNAVSVLIDANQTSSPIRDQDNFKPEYQYLYSFFSTSGFSSYATDMAIAHQISLMDLSGSEYNALKDAIDQGAENVINSMNTDQVNSNKLVSDLRYVIRSELRTLPDVRVEPPSSDVRSMIHEAIGGVLSTTREYGELFIGTTNGPFMILLKADSPQRFLDYAKEYPSHNVSIMWSTGEEEGGLWKIKPADNPNAYELRFKLPQKLYRYIFGTEEGMKSRAIEIKQKYFSNITVYRNEGDKDYLFRLKFDLEATRRNIWGTQP